MENKAFYSRYIFGQYPVIPSMELHLLLPYVWDVGGIIVTGECNDQLFGSDLMHRVVLTSGHKLLHEPATPLNFSIATGGFGWTHDVSQELYTDIMGSASKAGIVLTTVQGLFWWMNFAFKWQNVCLRMCGNKMPDELYHFFSTPEFQDWSVTGHQKKLPDTWRNYKLPAKRYIYRFNGCEEYLKHAVKIGSLNRVIKS